MLLIAKRLVVWLLETLCELLLLMALLFVLGGPSREPLSYDLAVAFFGVGTVFMLGSGYLVTTAICRVTIPVRKLWIYSMIAVLLFLGHEQFLVRGWDMPKSADLEILAPSACIVFGCTLAASWILRKWSQGDGVDRGLTPDSNCSSVPSSH